MQAALHDVEITLTAQNAKPSKAVLRIPKGQASATIAFSSSEVGSFRVAVSKKIPQDRITITPDDGLTLRFNAPKSHLGISIPSKILLTQKATVQPVFLDDSGMLVAPMQPQTVTIEAHGHGKLATNVVTIETNGVGSTVWTPYFPGSVTFKASLPGYETDSASLQVRVPIATIIVALLSGFIGGAVAAWRQKIRRKEFWLRLLVGSVTGFALFVCGEHGLLSADIAEFAASVFGTFFLAFAGGYLGTEAITLLLKKLGIIPPSDMGGASSSDKKTT
jgi:fluoride ion exporter CrcB/FEX